MRDGVATGPFGPQVGLRQIRMLYEVRQVEGSSQLPDQSLTRATVGTWSSRCIDQHSQKVLIALHSEWALARVSSGMAFTWRDF